MRVARPAVIALILAVSGCGPNTERTLLNQFFESREIPSLPRRHLCGADRFAPTAPVKIAEDFPSLRNADISEVNCCGYHILSP